MQYKFSYNFVRISPRKVRLVTNLVKNMNPQEALVQLKFLSKNAATPVGELVNSAITTCKEQGLDVENLKIVSITCDEGPALKRRRFKSKGRAHGIKKRSSHINIVLEEIKDNNKKPKAKNANKIGKKDK